MNTELIALLGVLSFLTDTVSAETCTYYRSCSSGYYCCNSNTSCCKQSSVESGTIAGIVIGFIFVGVVVFIVIYCYKRHHAHRVTVVQPASAPVVVQQQVSHNHAAPQPGYGPHYGNMPPQQNMGMYPPPPQYPPRY